VDRHERFASNLRRAREQSGLSQEEVGFRADLHRTEVSLLERAEREPRLGTLLKLAAALGVDPADLHAGIEWVPGQERFRVGPAQRRR
jgi:transcriptional regulator with XRE-family HTH domain